MRGIFGIEPGWGVTCVRVAMGMIFVVHGYMKWTSGMAAVSAAFAKMAIPQPGLWAPIVTGLELVGGIFLIVGLLARWVGIFLVIEMFVTSAHVQVPMHGWNASDLDRILLASGLLLFLAGPGKLALDNLWLEREG